MSLSKTLMEYDGMLLPECWDHDFIMTLIEAMVFQRKMVRLIEQDIIVVDER